MKNSGPKVLYGGVLMDKGERLAIDKILDSNWWGLSKEGKKFEKEIAAVQNVKYSVFVNSGTSALDLAIRALQLPKGSEVIVPACTFPTPISSIVREGLVPVVVDIDPFSYFISVEMVKKAVTKKTSAILIVYVAGLIGDLEGVMEVAREHNLKVIEDNCDGFGGLYKGKMIGSFGDVSAISTHAAHIISTGEGGVLFTDHYETAKIAYSIRDWGRITEMDDLETVLSELPRDHRRYFYTQHGSNYKPLELQAAMGRVQLKKLNRFKRLRKRNFEILYKELKPFEDQLILPESDKESEPCYFTFPLTLKSTSREKVLKMLDKYRIEWRPVLSSNISLQPGFKDHVVKRNGTPNADRLIHKGFWVPVHPQHTSKTMEYIARAIIKGIKG